MVCELAVEDLDKAAVAGFARPADVDPEAVMIGQQLHQLTVDSAPLSSERYFGVVRLQDHAFLAVEVDAVRCRKNQGALFAVTSVVCPAATQPGPLSRCQELPDAPCHTTVFDVWAWSLSHPSCERPVNDGDQAGRCWNATTYWQFPL